MIMYRHKYRTIRGMNMRGSRIFAIGLVVFFCLSGCAHIPDKAEVDGDGKYVGVPPMPSWHAEQSTDCYGCHNTPKPHDGYYLNVPADCFICHDYSQTGSGTGQGPARPAGHPDSSCMTCHTDAHNGKFDQGICVACHLPYDKPAPPVPDDHSTYGCLTPGCHQGIHLNVWQTTSACTNCHSFSE